MTTSFVAPRNAMRIAGGLAIVGAIALIIGLIVAPERTWLNLLVDGFYALSIGISGLFFIATQRLANSRWSVAIRRIPEAIMGVVPAGVVLLVILYFGFHSLYPWASSHPTEHEHALIRPGSETYLQPAFVYARMAITFALWVFFVFKVRRVSIAADADRQAGLRAHTTLNRYAGVFLVLFAISFTTVAYDFIVSLDPKWFSTMFAVYVFAGVNVHGLAGIALATVTLKKRGSFGPGASEIGNEPVHTLGTMVLAFSTFWAYIWVCQYLLIWYGNLPEEATYYLRRTDGWWLPVFLVSFLINWIIPFFVLLPRSSKRNLRIMAGVMMLIMFGRWLDIYIMVMPEHWSTPRVGPLEIAMAAGVGGLIYWLVVRGLSRAPLIPLHDPVIALRHAQAHAHGAHVEGGPS